MPKKSCRGITFISMRFMKMKSLSAKYKNNEFHFGAPLPEDSGSFFLEKKKKKKMVLNPEVGFRSHSHRRVRRKQ